MQKMQRRKREKIKTGVMLGVILILSALCAIIGIQAATLAQKTQFNFGTKFEAEVLIKVDLEVDGQYKTIFNSSAPASVDYAASFINNVTNDTIFLKQSQDYISNNTLNLKFYNYDTKHKINIYLNENRTPVRLAYATSNTIPMESEIVSVDVSGSESLLGLVLVSLQFEVVEEYTISFNSKGGSYCADLTFEKGQSLTLPTPTMGGGEFLGWYTSEDYQTQVTSTSQISMNTILYAKWIEIYKILNSGTYIYDDSGTYYPLLLSLNGTNWVILGANCTDDEVSGVDSNQIGYTNSYSEDNEVLLLNTNQKTSNNLSGVWELKNNTIYVNEIPVSSVLLLKETILGSVITTIKSGGEYDVWNSTNYFQSNMKTIWIEQKMTALLGDMISSVKNTYISQTTYYAGVVDGVCQYFLFGAEYQNESFRIYKYLTTQNARKQVTSYSALRTGLPDCVVIFCSKHHEDRPAPHFKFGSCRRDVH